MLEAYVINSLQIFYRAEFQQYSSFSDTFSSSDKLKRVGFVLFITIAGVNSLKE
jgi:hypothetical protein